MSRKQVVEELHKYKRKNFLRRKVILKGIDDLFQADLVEMILFKHENKNYKYILTVIDCFSKFAWGIPLKDKTAIEVTNAMKNIFNSSGRIPKNLQTDLGKEFYNKIFKNLMTEFKINHYSSFTHLKSSIVERFNRTLKEKMWKRFSAQGSYKWLNLIDELVDEYNNTKHRTINMKPIDVNSTKISNHLLKTAYNFKIILSKNKFKVGEHVRISKFKDIFEKGYTPNWSPEIFKIIFVNKKHPVTYLLEDYKKQKIKGQFYEKELQRTKYPNTYLVEKIVRTKGNEVLVKWLGFDKEHNSWVNKNEIM